MDPRFRLRLTQLQIAGLGIVVGVFGWWASRPVFCVIGAVIFIAGLLRLVLFNGLVKDMDFEPSSPQEEQNLKELQERPSWMNLFEMEKWDIPEDEKEDDW